MKRVLFYFLLLGLVCCYNPKKSFQNRFEFIPQETVLVAQVNDFNIIKNTFTSQPLLSKVHPLIDELVQPLVQLYQKMENRQSLVCLTPQGKSNFALSLIYERQIQDTIVTNFDKTITYEGVSIGVFNLNGKNYYEAQMGTVNYLSNSQLVLENSIRNYKNKTAGIIAPDFYRLTKTLDNNAPMQLLLHANAQILLESIFPETPLFPSISSAWIAFDFNTQRDPFTLDGVSFLTPLEPNPINFINGLSRQEMLSPEISPLKNTSFFSFAIEDMKVLEREFKNFSRSENLALSNIDFSPFAVVDELALLTINENDAVILHLKNSENINPLIFAENGTPNSYRSISYFPFELASDFKMLLSVFGSKSSLQWATRIDDFIVYGSSEETIKSIISGYKDGQVLATDFGFKNLMKVLANKSNFLWLGNTLELQSLWKKGAAKDHQEKWDAIPFTNYPLVALQGVGEDGFVQMRFTTQKDNPEMGKNGVVNQYSFQLEAAPVGPPLWIKNHRTKAMDLVLQDQQNKLYLFSNTGTLYWKKQLSGPILGPVKQVDLYKNKRLQMAFRTPNRFQILDRNGNLVPPFDIKLGQSEIPLSVFDYDRNRNYRFVVEEKNRLRMYDNSGSTVKGFRSRTLSKPLMYPLKHIRLGAKDYIVLHTEDGSIRLLNRQGEERVKIKNTLKTSNNSIFSYRNTFTTTDEKGNLIQIDQKGNVVSTPLELSPGHQIDMSTKSLVTLSDNILTIKGIPVALPYGNYTPPKLFYLNNTIYVTTTDKDAEKVYLFYSNGLAVDGFPVYGIGPADLSNADDDKALELVVQVDTNGFMIYQIN